jgi:3',5'-cyclic AMP phosphodiesterase CpdA
VALLFHLSDLHLLGDPREQETIFRSLVQTVAAEGASRGRADLLTITGDVFDSGSVDPQEAVGAFRRLLAELREALGDEVPTVVIPGNHDTRRHGVLGPTHHRLFEALAEAHAGDETVWIHSGGPFLAEVLPHAFHGLPLWLVAYDSNHLAGGAIGAGGSMRQEDLLRAAAIIDGHQPDWPVLFLLHHHLIATPLTDLGSIDVGGTPAPVRWLVERAMPTLLSHADREELFMIALGAGTALSTLHSLQRAVLVLHGHKHYATARHLSGFRDDQGDVMLVSAGSGGVAQLWRPAGRSHRDTARLWPSFNVIDLADAGVAVDQVSFPWKEADPSLVARRPMLRARRDGPRFIADPIAATPVLEPGPRLERNHSRVSLTPSLREGRWDLAVTRHVRFSGRDERYVEIVDGAPGARLNPGPGTWRVDDASDLPAQLRLAPSADGVRYTLEAGLIRSFEEEQRLNGRDATPYGRAALMNRYQCSSARLTVAGLGPRAETAFGSATDLGTGLERPVAVRLEGDEVHLEVRNCPPRTLLRVYWLYQGPWTGEVLVVPPAAPPARAEPEPDAEAG